MEIEGGPIDSAHLSIALNGGSQMLLGADPGVAPSLDALLPDWAQQLSLLMLLIVIVTAFMRGWVVTKSQNERDIRAERRVSDIWEKNAAVANSQVDRLTDALQPVLDGNSAILKAVSEVQEEQRRMRERDIRGRQR